MKERPILFSGPMVKAILDGSKTTTRRVVKHPPLTSANDFDDYNGSGTIEDGSFVWHTNPKSGSRICVNSPYGEKGNRLWVKETYCRRWDGDGFAYNEEGNLDPSCCYYRADGIEPDAVDGDGFKRWNKDDTEASPWSSPIYMPRWASRILLEVTEVRVERVEDISEDDAKAEGFDSREAFLTYFYDVLKVAPRGSNDWVWVVSFKVTQPLQESHDEGGEV